MMGDEASFGGRPFPNLLNSLRTWTALTVSFGGRPFPNLLNCHPELAAPPRVLVADHSLTC